MLSRCKNSVKKWVPCVLNHWYHSVHVKVFVSLGLINYRIFSFHESRIYSYIICTWRSMSWRHHLRSSRSAGRRESDCSSSVTQASASITCSSTKTSTTAPTSRNASTMKRTSTIRGWIWNTATKMWAYGLLKLLAWVSQSSMLGCLELKVSSVDRILLTTSRISCCCTSRGRHWVEVPNCSTWGRESRCLRYARTYT